MTVELSKEDLQRLIRGTSPGYSQFKQLEAVGLGRYTGGFVDRWDWQQYSPAWNDFSEADLWALYKKIQP